MPKVNKNNGTKKSQKRVQASLSTEHGNSSQDFKKEPFSPTAKKTKPSDVEFNKSSTIDVLEDYDVIIEQPGQCNNEEPEVFQPDNLVKIHSEEPEVFMPDNLEQFDRDEPLMDPISLEVKTEPLDDEDVDTLVVRNIEDMPRGKALETPLRPKKRRVWQPPATTELEEQAASPPTSPLPSPPDVDLMEILHYGSDPDSDQSGDEEVACPRVLARTLLSEMETPLDEDFGEPEVLAVESAVPAAAAEDVPLMATDQPWRWYDFEWKQFPKSPIPPESRRETFSQINVGPTTPRDDPYDIFIDIWDRPIMEHIASETNKYAQLLAVEQMSSQGRGNLHPNSRISRWRDTSPDELFTFFGMILAMGVIVKSRLDEYWSATGDIFYTPGFSAHMPIDRFLLLCRCLHFNDVGGMRGLALDSSEAKLFKIQPILSHLNKKFQELYTPSQNISLDESLLMWKGWLDIGQLIPNKAAKRGIKTYEICESQTGYLWRFEVHAHKRFTSPPQRFDDPLEAPTPSQVLRLIQGLEYKGYTLWMDNFYNSPCLARRLKCLGFDCVGTLRTNRRFVPESLHNLTKQNMRRGQISGLTAGDIDVMVWRDCSRVAMISTYHGNGVQTARGSTKPILIHDYNIMMGGVDKKDQLLAMYPVERKRTMVWYKKFFRRLLNISVLNSYIIHRHSTSSSLSHRSFRVTLIKSLLSRHRVLPVPSPIAPNRRDGGPFLATLHRLEPFQVVDPAINPRRQRRLCIICKKRVQTYCVGCNKALCMVNCFLKQHSVTHLSV